MAGPVSGLLHPTFNSISRKEPVITVSIHSLLSLHTRQPIPGAERINQVRRPPFSPVTNTASGPSCLRLQTATALTTLPPKTIAKTWEASTALYLHSHPPLQDEEFRRRGHFLGKGSLAAASSGDSACTSNRRPSRCLRETRRQRTICQTT